MYIDKSADKVSNSGLSLLLGNTSNDDNDNDKLFECGLTDDETISDDEEAAQEDNENEHEDGSDDDNFEDSVIHINTTHHSLFMTNVALVWKKGNQLSIVLMQ